MVWGWGLLTFVGAALVVLAPRLARAKLQAQASKRRLFSGHQGQLTLQLSVCAPLPVYIKLEWNPLGPLGVPPGERRALVWREAQLSPALPYRPRTQGRHPLPSAWLTISDVLGIYQRELPLVVQDDPGILAYPRVLPLTGPDLLLTLLAEGPEARGVGVEDASRFAGAREYVPGDPVNRVHWPSTAKRGAIIVKEFAKVRATGVWVHLDTTGRGKMGEVYLEHSTGLAASLLAAAEREGLRSGLSASGQGLPLGRGEAHMAHILAHLAGLEPSDQETPLPDIPAGVNLIVISYQVPLALLEQTLKAHAKAAQVHVIALPEGFYLRPGETGRPLYHNPDSLARLNARRTLLTAEGVRVHLLRGNQSLARLRSR